MATDLTMNYMYDKFAPLNVWNFAPLHVFIHSGRQSSLWLPHNLCAGNKTLARQNGLY